MAKKKITCKSFLEDMNDYLDGDLPEELRISVEAHLGKCPDCWVLFDETKKTVEIFQNMDCHPMPEEVHDRLLSAIGNSWKGRE